MFYIVFFGLFNVTTIVILKRNDQTKPTHDNNDDTLMMDGKSVIYNGYNLYIINSEF